IVNGGFRGNVIPGSAQVMLNVRSIPGTNPAEVAAAVRRVIADSTVDVQLQVFAQQPIPVSSDTTALYRALAAAAKAEFPEAEVTSYLFQAGTDSFAWRSRGVPVYGIYP